MMAGIEGTKFFGTSPKWLEQSIIEDSEKLKTEDLDVDKFISRIGFYQR